FTPCHWRHTRAFEGLVRKFRGLVVAKTMKTQRPINEIVAIRARRERVKLRAVAYLPEKLDGLLRGKTKNINRAVGWFDQPRQQIHQRGLAGAVGADEAGNPRLEREVHFVHAEN